MRTVDEIKADIDTGNYDKYEEDRLWLEWFRAVAKEVSPDRLQEICEAEADGRLVVLPCKVGDTIYVVGLKCLVENILRRECVMFECDDCNKKADYEIFKKTATVNFIQRLMSEKDDLFVIGKSVFFTREEAEAALKGAEHD